MRDEIEEEGTDFAPSFWFLMKILGVEILVVGLTIWWIGK